MSLASLDTEVKVISLYDFACSRVGHLEHMNHYFEFFLNSYMRKS